MAWLILLSGILNLFLGLIVWLRDLKNRLNLGFGVFSLSTVVLILFDFFFRFNPTVFILKSSYAFAALIPVTALVWILEMCRIDASKFSSLRKILIFLPGLAFFVLPYIDNLIVVQVHSLTLLGYIGQLGPLFALYAFYFFVYILAFIILLYRAQRNSIDRIHKIQIRFVLTGVVLYSLTALTSSLILPKFFGIFDFTLLDAPSLIFFVGFTAYAILRLHLFNIKVIATELLVFALSLFILIRVIISENDMLINGGIFVAVIIVGIFLIRSVINEVKQREKIDKTNKELDKVNAELEVANKRQKSLLHEINHDVKEILTEATGGFSALKDGDLGELPSTAKTFIETAFAKVREGTRRVMDFLHATNLDKGTVSFAMKPFDLRQTIEKVIDNHKQTAEEEGLKLEINIKDADYMFTGDEGQLSLHVFDNLISNAISYNTPQGVITVLLSKPDDKILFTVKDTGIGITPEDMANLFTEGGHGKESTKINVHSTGNGLFIAKGTVLAHHGKIWAESEGAGKGSTFFVELPIAGRLNK